MVNSIKFSQLLVAYLELREDSIDLDNRLINESYSTKCNRRASMQTLLTDMDIMLESINTSKE